MPSRRPKVLHVFKTASPISFGGVEDVINNIASTTSDRFEHTVLCTNKDRDLVCTEKSYELISFKYNFSFSNNPVSLAFHSYLFKHSKDYDVVHFHFPYPMMDFHYFMKTPYIITYHSDLLRSKLVTLPYRVLAKRFLKNAGTVVYTSNKYASFSNFKKYVNNTCVIPLTASALAETFLDKSFNENDYFLYIGAFRKYKDLGTLVRAAIQADVDLVLLGDGETKEDMQKLVRENNASRIHFIGDVSETKKYELLSKARALILPSNKESEAFGVVLLEAATMGKPIITANLKSGTTEVNTHNLNGMTFEKSNISELVQILKLFATNDDLCDRLGHENRKKYVENYSRRLFGESYKRVYDLIISGKK